MALIKCNECGAEISEHAKKCPKCGATTISLERVKSNKKSKTIFFVSLVIVAILLTLGAILLINRTYMVDRREIGEEADETNVIVEITPEFISRINRYEEVSSYSEGMAAVLLDGNWGYINTTGEEVVPCQYSDYTPASKFSEGLAYVRMGNDIGYLNHEGQEVIPFNYISAYPFSEGLAKVRRRDASHDEFINKEGETVLLCSFAGMGDSKFIEGLLPVKMDGKWGYINTNGDIVIPCKYDYAFSFSEGLARIEQNGRIGFINTEGEEVIPSSFSQAGNFSDGRAYVTFDNILWGYINTSGEIIIPIQYQWAQEFSEGLAAVRNDSGYGYINTAGDVVIDFKYELALSFSEGLAWVEIGDKLGCINSNGYLIIPFQYENVWSFSNGVAKVKKNNRYGYVDKMGNDTFN